MTAFVYWMHFGSCIDLFTVKELVPVVFSKMKL